MKAIILAGGKGSRFKPITNTIPKALLPINDSKTLIETVLEKIPSSVDTVIVITKYLGKKIQQYLGETYQDKNLIYAPQDIGTNGTWSAFYAAKPHIEKHELFCVFNCDDIFDTRELEQILQKQKVGLGATRTTFPAKYHGVRTTAEGYMEHLEKHPNENREELVEDLFANGFFVLDGNSFDFPPVQLIDGEYGLPQTILAQKETYPLFVFEMNHWQPCNTFEDLEKIKSYDQKEH